MVWLVVVKNIESGGLEIITPDMVFDPDNPRYDNVAHIIPYKEEPDPQRLSFGVHELVSDCACHPRVTNTYAGTRIISHREAVN